jgi:hypothetical protein
MVRSNFPPNPHHEESGRRPPSVPNLRRPVRQATQHTLAASPRDTYPTRSINQARARVIGLIGCIPPCLLGRSSFARHTLTCTSGRRRRWGQPAGGRQRRRRRQRRPRCGWRARAGRPPSPWPSTGELGLLKAWSVGRLGRRAGACVCMLGDGGGERVCVRCQAAAAVPDRFAAALRTPRLSD